MVYVFDELEKVKNIEYEYYKNFLPASRVKKAENFYYMKDRKLSMLVYFLLCIGLYNEYGIKSPVLLEENYMKKPKLKEYPDIHFSFSHCDKGVACAIDNNEVGLDIQNYSLYESDIIYEVLTYEEEQFVKNSINPAKSFINLWTLKECYGKYIGQGISYNLNKYDFSKICTAQDKDYILYNVEDKDLYFKNMDNCQYALSVCGNKKLNIRYVNKEELL